MATSAGTAAEREARLAANVAGIWEKNPSVWTDNPAHLRSIPKWLGWLESATAMRAQVPELAAFADEVRHAGYTHALLLGMGGSSLAPEVLARTCGVRDGFLQVHVLDSTDPAVVLDFRKWLPAGKTLYIVATKSGTTTETLAFQRFFYAHVQQTAGERAGESFVAITDPGSSLDQAARDLRFRRTFLNAPDIGGRFSALSYFGLVPAALLGVDLDALLGRAEEAMRLCRPAIAIADNPGAQLGAALAGHAAAGRDKVTLVLDQPFDSFGYWVEQLLAESTGKDGKGLVPVEGEPLGPPEVYGADRLFVSLGRAGDDPRLAALERAGHPVLRLPAEHPTDLGYQFFVWEFATAVAGTLMGIDAFDQPNVQESKDNTERVLAEYQASGALPDVPEIVPGTPGVQSLNQLLIDAADGEYVALLAYVPWTPETADALAAWRLALRDHRKLATTLGFGPRFLHSTGQLHKGGPNTGVFVQLVSEDPEDAPVPGAPYTFGTLKQAQAIGDLQALQAHGRRVVRVKLPASVPAAVRGLATETVPLFPWRAQDPPA